MIYTHSLPFHPDHDAETAATDAVHGGGDNQAGGSTAFVVTVTAGGGEGHVPLPTPSGHLVWQREERRVRREEGGEEPGREQGSSEAKISLFSGVGIHSGGGPNQGRRP